MYQVQAEYQNRWINWAQARDHAAAVSAVNLRFAQYNHQVAFRALDPRGQPVYRMAA